MQKLLTFFQQKYWRISDINVWNFNEMLTDEVVSFEPGHGLWLQLYWYTIIFTKGNNLSDILFASGAEVAHPNWGALWRT